MAITLTHYDVMFFPVIDSIETEEILQTHFHRRILSNTEILNCNSTNRNIEPIVVKRIDLY